MAEDTPDDVLHMELLDAVFPGHPLGRETLGSRDTIESLGRDAIAGFELDSGIFANAVAPEQAARVLREA